MHRTFSIYEYLGFWALFAVVVGVLVVLWQRERERNREQQREIEARDDKLHDCAIHLFAARRKGQRVEDRRVDLIVAHALAWCPRSPNHKHRAADDSPSSCRSCGYDLRNVDAAQKGAAPPI